MGWIVRDGDSDGDGFIEHATKRRRRTSGRLRNEGWKDSSDSISFADGRLAEGPVALAEVQGYVYDAKLRMASVYVALGKIEAAERLEREALDLKRDFNQAFWVKEEGFFAVALDGRKNPVDSITSNPGHCLWSGIVDDTKATQVVDRLMAPDMFSGWGIRTLSTQMGRYDPVSYHNGSVWPHDTSLIAAGMSRYGFTKQAGDLSRALIDAASAFPRNRPPELFAGYPRRAGCSPVQYAEANAPQAWASGAVIYGIETLLGVTQSGDQLLKEAPPEGPFISLRGVSFRGSKRIL